jgi:hypothetical protein
MSKTFINIEEKLIDVNHIKLIDRGFEWDEKEERIMFFVGFNNPKYIKIDTFNPVIFFKYATEQMRDEVYQEIYDKLEEFGIEFV